MHVLWFCHPWHRAAGQLQRFGERHATLFADVILALSDARDAQTPSARLHLTITAQSERIHQRAITAGRHPNSLPTPSHQMEIGQRAIRLEALGDGNGRGVAERCDEHARGPKRQHTPITEHQQPPLKQAAGQRSIISPQPVSVSLVVALEGQRYLPNRGHSRRLWEGALTGFERVLGFSELGRDTAQRWPRRRRPWRP